MSIVKARTNPYGPATLDVQIEQGADFYLPFDLTRGGAPWDISDDAVTFDAHFSLAWSPGGTCVPLEVTKTGASSISVKFPAASSLNIRLPDPPRKTVNPEKFTLGGWLLNIYDPSISDAPTKRLAEGTVTMDRDPCLA